MNELNFCCNGFKFYCKAPNGATPAFRVIKLTSEEFTKRRQSINFGKGLIYKFKSKSKTPYRFFITYGYDKFDPIATHYTVINYCPFCGRNLEKYYAKDEFVNEIEGITFKV